MPPSFLDGFSTNDQMNTTFCTEMGTLTEDNGTVIDLGKKLCRGSWNAQPYGPLYPAMVEGLASGTDLYFHKSRCSVTYFFGVLALTMNRSLERALGSADTPRLVPPRVRDYHAVLWWREQRPVCLGQPHRCILQRYVTFAD